MKRIESMIIGHNPYLLVLTKGKEALLIYVSPTAYFKQNHLLIVKDVVMLGDICREHSKFEIQTAYYSILMSHQPGMVIIQ